MKGVLIKVICLLFLVLSTADFLSAQAISPETYLGRPVGTDFELADWDQLAAYFDRLGRDHPCVMVKKVGKTTEGRDFRIVIISSEENLADLENLKGLMTIRNGSYCLPPRGNRRMR